MQARLPTQERQAEIVAAALRLTHDASPAQVTTGDIAAAIQVTQGAVFKHFRSKDAIWLAAMAWVRAELLGRLDDASQDVDDPMQALAGMFRAHVDFVIAHPGVPRLIFHELQQPTDSATKRQVRGLLRDYRARLLAQLSRARGQGRMAPGLDPDAAAASFVGLVQGLVMQSMLAGRPSAMRRQADKVFALYARALEVRP